MSRATACRRFAELLRRVAEFYRARRADIAQQGEALSAAFAELSPPVASGNTALTLQPIDNARERLAANFDARYGGFGDAPKFPHPTNIELLLRCWRASAASDEPDLHSLYMATLTLTRMAEGGIYDQLAGGFSRYSVDEYWMIPHFEKCCTTTRSCCAFLPRRQSRQASRSTAGSLAKPPTG